MMRIIDIHNIRHITLAKIKEEGVFLVIKKPATWSSFQLVKKVRYLLKIDKVGHAGTLDPLAEGLMLIAVGRQATRQINQHLKQAKRYQAIIELGKTTKSYDLETEPQYAGDYKQITHEKIHTVIQSFIGEQMQTPPQFSAIKKDGKRLYESARKGIVVDVPKRAITFFDIQILSIHLPQICLDIHCSSGTYIRSLAYDIGEKLGCGAYLHHLVRTHIGDFSLEDAIGWEALLPLTNQKG